MKIYKQPKVIIAIQSIIITIFIMLVYYNAIIFFDIQKTEDDITQLRQTSFKIEEMKSSLTEFKKIRKQLIPCNKLKDSFYWQEVELNFNDISFTELIKRLLFLNKTISEKYNKRGLFLLTKFESIRDKKVLQDANNTEENSLKDLLTIKPSFLITGRLLCLCQ